MNVSSLMRVGRQVTADSAFLASKEISHDGSKKVR